MGGDCSSCKCNYQDDEKILIIQDVDKSFKDSRKSKIEQQNNINEIHKAKSSTNHITNESNFSNTQTQSSPQELLKEIYSKNPGLEQKIIKIQGLFKKTKARNIYLLVRKKLRVCLCLNFIISYFTILLYLIYSLYLIYTSLYIIFLL